jgi:hypothetical protein
VSIQSNFTIFQGEDVRLNFQLTPAQDVTSWTLTGTVRNSLGGASQFTYTPVIDDGPRGQFHVSWTRAQTTGLAIGDYVWDVRRTDSGNNSVLAHGAFQCKQPVTS